MTTDSVTVIYHFTGQAATPLVGLLPVPGELDRAIVHVTYYGKKRPQSTLQIAYRPTTKKGTPSQNRATHYGKLTRALATELGLAAEHIEQLFPARKPKAPAATA